MLDLGWARSSDVEHVLSRCKDTRFVYPQHHKTSKPNKLDQQYHQCTQLRTRTLSLKQSLLHPRPSITWELVRYKLLGQPVKLLATKPGDLNPITGVHRVGENQYPQAVLFTITHAICPLLIPPQARPITLRSHGPP